MRRSAALVLLLVAFGATLLAFRSQESKPKLTVIYYYLPG
jgi:hypothetical protein